MEIISLLGAILDLAAANRIAWDLDDGNSGTYLVHLTEQEVPGLKHITESLLEGDEEVDNGNYNDVTVVFENERISKVLYGKEEHDVKENVNSYVKDFGIKVIYVAMCAKILEFLDKELGL